jgi:3-(3-hydroxy-phenyl)propionate hydroxylase
VTATLLAQRGITCVLIERHQQPYPLPRAVHVDDEVMRILQQVGVATDFAALARPAAGLRLLDARHQVLAQFRRDRLEGVHGHPQSTLFDQPDLERLLRANLARHPQITLRTGTELLGHGPRPAPPAGPGPGPQTQTRTQTQNDSVILREVSSGAESTLTVRAILGCDGANSTVRDLIASSYRDLGFEERWLVLDIECSAPLSVWDGVEQICDPARPATSMRIGRHRYRWEFRLRPDESAADLTGPAHLAALLAPWAPGIDPGALHVRRAAEYTFRARIAGHWRRGMTFLLGDAAHLTPPFIGQGLGSGLRDAANLTWKLALALDPTPARPAGLSADALLDTYQSEREPHARALIRLAVATGWAMTGGRDRAAAIRGPAVRIGCRLPGATRLILSSTSPPLRPGPLVHRTHRRRVTGRDLAGTLCPQPWVEALTPSGTWQRRRLDDVLGPGFALLTTATTPTPSAPGGGRAVRRIQVLPGVAAGAGALTSAGADAVVRSDELSAWLSRSGAAAALIRPDRVVLATAPAPRIRRPPARSSRISQDVSNLSGLIAVGPQSAR